MLTQTPSLYNVLEEDTEHRIDFSKTYSMQIFNSTQEPYNKQTKQTKLFLCLKNDIECS
jgi:hypothetical protein